MITLPANFQTRANNNDTQRIVLVHLYYSDTNYIPVATTQTVIGGVQYLGILQSISDITQQWNIEDKNNVTISSPKIVLADYQTPDGYSILDDFLSHNIYGRRLVLYLTYEGLTLDDSIKVFDGWTDDMNYSDNSITVTGKTSVIPVKDISGRTINYDTQKIGDIGCPTGYKILKDFDKKNLPVVLGNHWCSPIVPYMQDNSIDWTKYYSSIDTQYSPLIKVESNIKTDIKQYNISKTTSSILIFNNDYYTPLHETDYTSDITKVYNIAAPDAEIMPGIILPYQGGHTKKDGNLFLTVPLRYYAKTELADWITFQGTSSYDAVNTFSKVFDGTDSTPYVFANDRSSWLRLWVKAILSVNKNLKGDEKGFVREGRKIHIPETESHDGGQGFLFGRWDINIGAMGWFHDDIWADVDTYPFKINHWKGGYLASAFDGTAKNLPNYIGAGTHGNLTPEDIRVVPYRYQYNLQARVVTNQAGAIYYDYANDDTVRRAGLQGNDGLTTNMGKAPFVNRDAFSDGDLGAALEFYSAFIQKFDVANDNKVSLYKVYHMTAGSIDFSAKDNFYGSVKGYKLLHSNSLVSVPQNTSEYQLRRPYEYIEFLIRKAGESSLGSSFNYANISSAWESFYSTKRDYSGFTIIKELTLDKFISEYQEYEPYSVFVSEDGKFNFAMLKKSYTESDVVDTLNYADATGFNMSLTDSNKIVAEIAHVKTDYMPEADDYVIDAHYKLDGAEYDFAHWKYGNTADNNSFILDTIEKKYTSYTPVDIVIYGGKHWGCVWTNTNQAPASDSLYWAELNEPTATVSWNPSTLYNGSDVEAYMVASYNLNQWANRHRVVTFETDNLSYLRFNIGDVVSFSNVPKSLLGVHIKGFGGATNFSSSINNQEIYAAFVITSVRKSLKKVTIETVQLHNLSAYTPVRV
jgi:hypothetical protein